MCSNVERGLRQRAREHECPFGSPLPASIAVRTQRVRGLRTPRARACARLPRSWLRAARLVSRCTKFAVHVSGGAAVRQPAHARNSPACPHCAPMLRRSVGEGKQEEWPNSICPALLETNAWAFYRDWIPMSCEITDGIRKSYQVRSNPRRRESLHIRCLSHPRASDHSIYAVEYTVASPFFTLQFRRKTWREITTCALGRVGPRVWEPHEDSETFRGSSYLSISLWRVLASSAVKRPPQFRHYPGCTANLP